MFADRPAGEWIRSSGFSCPTGSRHRWRSVATGDTRWARISVPDRQSGARVEEVQSLGVNHYADLVADPDPRSRREGRDESGRVRGQPGVVGAGVVLEQFRILGDDLGHVEVEMHDDLRAKGLS